MPTFLTIATQAMNRLGVIAAGETPSTGDATLCLDAMNQLLDQWKSVNLLLYAEVRTTWTIVASQVSYSVGTGGDIAIPRPVYVDRCSYVLTTQTPPLEIQMSPYTDFTWAQVSLKSLTSNLPINYYYNLTYPLATLYLWPIPTQANLQGVLYTRTQVAQLAALSTSVSLPNGWQRMMVTNLAVEIAPMFFKEPSKTLLEQAKNSMAAVKRSNNRNVDLQTPSGALIQTGNTGGFWNHAAFLSGGSS